MTETTTIGAWSNWRTRPLPEGEWALRTGRKIGRNLYIEWPDGRSEPVGQVDSAALAALIVQTVNNARAEGTPTAPEQAPLEDWTLAETFELAYPIEATNPTRRPAELWRHRMGLTACVLTEHMGAPGQSITNGAESISHALWGRYGHDMLHIERYIREKETDFSLVLDFEDQPVYWKHLASGAPDQSMTEVLNRAALTGFRDGMCEDITTFGRRLSEVVQWLWSQGCDIDDAPEATDGS